MNIVTFIALSFIMFWPFLAMCLWFVEGKEINNKKNKDVECFQKNSAELKAIKPELKILSQEQIEDIHSRGKITPAEMVEEWDALGLCAPGYAIGSAGWRCKKFKCCHDCLVDYANERDEYTSIFDIMKNNKYKL